MPHLAGLVRPAGQAGGIAEPFGLRAVSRLVSAGGVGVVSPDPTLSRLSGSAIGTTEPTANACPIVGGRGANEVDSATWTSSRHTTPEAWAGDAGNSTRAGPVASSSTLSSAPMKWPGGSEGLGELPSIRHSGSTLMAGFAAPRTDPAMAMPNFIRIAGKPVAGETPGRVDPLWIPAGLAGREMSELAWGQVAERGGGLPAKHSGLDDPLGELTGLINGLRPAGGDVGGRMAAGLPPAPAELRSLPREKTGSALGGPGADAGLSAVLCPPLDWQGGGVVGRRQPAQAMAGDVAGGDDARGRQNSPAEAEERQSGGVVMLDGRLVGQWIMDRLGREAGRPSVGMTGFNVRQGVAWNVSGATF